MGPIHHIDGIMGRFMYRDILRDNLKPFLFESVPVTAIFMHDYDPKHKSTLVKDYLAAEKINVMEWPAKSPDLNPIENLWELVDRQIRKNTHKNKAELRQAIEDAWRAVPSSVLVSLMESMPRRCSAVIKAKGQHTKY